MEKEEAGKMRNKDEKKDRKKRQEENNTKQRNEMKIKLGRGETKTGRKDRNENIKKSVKRDNMETWKEGGGREHKNKRRKKQETAK